MTIGAVKVARTEDFGSFIPGEIGIRVEPMLRIQGHTDPSRARPAIRESAMRMAQLAEKRLAAEVFYRRVGVQTCANGVLTLTTGTTFHNDAFSEVLPDCAEIVVFILTAGMKLDMAGDTLQQTGEILDQLFLETAGWLAVEGVTKAFAEHLRTLAKEEGCRITRRLGPGYGDWPLEEQPALFDLFEQMAISVRLLEGCAMIPKMSRSGLYGLRPLTRASDATA